MTDVSRSESEQNRHPAQLANTGEIYSFTIVQEPPSSHEWQSPYVLALVQLDDGPMVIAQLTDLDRADSVSIGDQVEMVTRKLATEGDNGLIVYGYKFRKQLN